MHFIRSKATLAVLTCLCLGLCLFVTACSDKDREKGGIPESGANVRFTFDLAAGKSKVPVEVKAFQFLGYADEEMTGEAIYTPQNVAKDDSKLGATQEIILENVPLEVVIFRVNFLSQDGKALYTGVTKPLDLAQGTTVDAEIVNAEREIDVTINITNAYALNIPKAKYAVELVNSKGETVKSEGETEYKLSGDVGSCTLVCTVPEDEYGVTSVTLTNPEKNTAFEWLDYDAPQALTDGAITLDTNKNEFANTTGDGTENKPYVVANPRQLANIDNYPTGDPAKYVYVSQIRDIDFAGSCGFTLAIDFDKNNNIVATPTDVDSTARFYNKDVAHPGSRGWVGFGNLEDESKTPTSFVYQGNGNTIDNLLTYDPVGFACAGLFRYCLNLKVSDLTIGANSVFYGSYAGGLIGFVGGNDPRELLLTKCHSQATVAVSATEEEAVVPYSCGGLCGVAIIKNLSVEDCTATGGSRYGENGTAIGGLLGAEMCRGGTATFSNCEVSSKICAVDNCAGGCLTSSISGATVNIKDCQVTSVFDIRSSADQATSSNASAGCGGLVAVCNVPQLNLDGSNMSAATFDYTKYNGPDGIFIGGVFASVESSSQGASEILEAIKKHTTSSSTATGTSEQVKFNQYCVDPEYQ